MAETLQMAAPGSKLVRQVTGWLTKEFGDRVDPDIIHRARVQEFVATISWRQARVRLADLAVQRRLAS